MTQRMGMLYLILLASLTLLIAGCLPEPPVRGFATVDLLVDTATFPQGWDVTSGPEGAIQSRRQIDGAYVGLEVQKPRLLVAQHQIFRYRSMREASEEYHRQMQEEFFAALMVVPWQVPRELPYQSPAADQFRFACAVIELKGRTLICKAMGQYAEYLSVFNAAIDPDFMTFTDLERILQSIDERMARALGKPLPPSVAPP